MKHSKKHRFETLETRRLLAADPIITEFVSSNQDTLLDGYGATPDWIEVFNNGDAAVDLEGYSLTDDPDEIDKWEFPSTTIQPDEYLIVFASGIDAIDPAGNLHTNFGLSASGDYLALATPQGALLSEFGINGADYPEQLPNTSYGLGFNSTFTAAVTPSSPVKYFVPTDSSFDANWFSPGFDDTAWSDGQASLGYEAEEDLYAPLIQTDLPIGTTSTYVRIPFQSNGLDATIGTLGLRYDDGFVAYLNGVRIASSHAPEALGFDSMATEFRPREAAVQEAAINVSSYSDALLTGGNVLAIHLMDSPESPSQDLLLTASLTVAQGSLSASQGIGFLQSPTPGEPNTATHAGEVVFSNQGGVFQSTFSLVLTPSVAGESIRYTLDGSTPNASSALYAGPITIGASIAVRAQAFSLDGRSGRVTSAAFTKTSLPSSELVSTLPIVVLENYGGGKPNRAFQDAYLSLYDVNPSTGQSSLTEDPSLTTPIGQHRRGSSTYGSPKYSLRVELRDENGFDKAQQLLDLPAESDWILYGAGFFDRSLIRNAVAYDLSNQADNPAVRTRYVEVYNVTDGGQLGSAEYFGVYVLMENIKDGPDRVDVASLDPSATESPEITGGYVFKQDRNDSEEDSSWTTDRNQPIGSPKLVHVSPERESLTADQTDYLRGYIQDFEDALYGPNATDPDTGYEAYIESDSWIEHHLLRTFINDADTLFLSEHFSKDQGGKIEAGPVWDFNLSSGHDGSAVPEEWARSKFNSGWWWGRLFDDPDFAQLWVDKWSSLRSGPLSNANLLATVDRHAEEIRDATDRNFDQWTGQRFSPREDGVYVTPGLTGWEAEVSQLSGWLIARAEWIDQTMTPLTEFSVDGGTVLPGTQVGLAVSDSGATIYYTTDGSDPRGDNGSLSPTAIVSVEDIVVNSTATLKARAYNAAREGTELGPWGPLSVARYSTDVPADSSNLRISELHYNPLDPTSSELLVVPGADNNSFEFVELVNIGSQPIDMTGVLLADGIEFDFGSGRVISLSPGEVVLVVQNEAAFEARYGGGLLIAGEYDGRLSGGGDEVELIAANGSMIEQVEYEDDSPWPEAADGDGPSLERIDLLSDGDTPGNWRASLIDDGTPGAVTLPLNGDYDRNGIVDHLDRSLWVGQYGTSVGFAGEGADGNRDGVVDAADYSVWRDNVGATTQPTISLAIARSDDSLAQPLVCDTEALVQETEEGAASQLPWRFTQPLSQTDSPSPSKYRTVTGSDGHQTRDAAMVALLLESPTLRWDSHSEKVASESKPHFENEDEDELQATDGLSESSLDGSFGLWF